MIDVHQLKPKEVKLIDIIMDTNKLYLVFEFLFMDLKKYIDDQKHQSNRIDPELSRSYMFQMLQVNIKIKYRQLVEFNRLQVVKTLAFHLCVSDFSIQH